MKHRVSASLIKGTIVLTIFAFLGKALGALFKIGLTNLVGTQGMGIYGLLFPIFVFFEILASDGFCLGLTVNIAKHKKENMLGAYKSFALRLILLSSLIAGVVIALLSPIISSLQGGTISVLLYFEVALCVIVVSILGYYKAVVRGHEDFKLYSITEVVEDITKILFALILAYFLKDYGVEASIAGVFGGIIISGLLSIITLLIFGKKYNKREIEVKLTNFEKNSYLKFSIIATISAIIVPALQFIDSVLIVRLLGGLGLTSQNATSLFGLSRGSVAALLNLPAFLLVSFEFLLLPSLSRSKSDESQDKTGFSLILAFFVSLPFTLIYLMFPTEILYMLYGNAFSQAELIVASRLLVIGSLSLTFSALSGIIVVRLESEGKTMVPLIAALIAGIIKIVFLIIFVPKLSIYGAELSSVLFALVEALIVFSYAFYKSMYIKPKAIWLVALFWVVIVGVIYLWYFALQKMLDRTWALIIATVLTILIFMAIASIAVIILKKKHKKIEIKK